MAYGFTYTLPTITGSHSDFPVLLREDDFPTAAIDGGSSSILNGGGNLRAYTSSAKTTQLPVEVVTFVAGGTPDAEVWVKVPTAATSNTIYIEADSVATVQPAVTNTYGRNAVWADYYAVLHLTNSGLVDATGNGHDGTATGSLSYTATDHPWGGLWASFDNNVNEYITIGSSTGFGDSAADATVSVWVKANSDAVGGIISNRLSTESVDWFQVNKRSAVNEWQFSAHDGTAEAIVKPLTAAANSHLMHLAIDSGTMIPSIDGASVGTPTFSGDGLVNSSNNITIGHYYDLSVTAYDFYGYIGEVRLRESYLSVDWRAAEYANQSAATAWGTVGTWADSGGPSAYSITGSVTASATPAATLDFQRHAAITGSVTVAVTPAATTGFNSGYTILGNVSVSVTPSATLNYSQHHAIVGDVTATFTPAATMAQQSHHAIVGDVTATITPASTLYFGSGEYIQGNVTITATPSGLMSFTRHAAIAGNVTVNLTPAAVMAAQQNHAITGDVAATVTPASSMDFTTYVPLSLSQNDLDAIADAVWTRLIDSLTAEQSMRVMLAAMAGKVSGADSNTITFRDTDDTKDRIIATVDGQGNRTGVTLDVSE